MTRRAAFKQADVSRILKAVKKNGGGYQVLVEGGVIRLLPIDDAGASTAADDAERRMKEAFGE